ncbi:MAG: hypothetical protein MZU79_04165 [Anaerotruncus sp.]|nr:hypothetical protein [Anaerotruncus sp.]
MDKKSSDLNLHQRMELHRQGHGRQGDQPQGRPPRVREDLLRANGPEARGEPDQDGQVPGHPPEYPPQPGQAPQDQEEILAVGTQDC